MQGNIYKGVITALITPFTEGEIDFSALKLIIERQVNADINSIVVGGSSGEGNSLSAEQYYSLIKEAKRIASGRIAVIAGMTAVSTDEAIAKLDAINKIPIDGIMCTPPHYIRPGQEGIIEHFSQLYHHSNLPIMLYIHPARTGVELTDATILNMVKNKYIVALKDAGNDITRPLRITAAINKAINTEIALSERESNMDHLINFNMLAGDDLNFLAYSANGGKGVVSVAANIVPELCQKLYNDWQEGKKEEALQLQQILLPLYNALNLESNPTGVKYAASFLNLCKNELKLPLLPAAPETGSQIEAALNLIFAGYSSYLKSSLLPQA